MTEDFTPDTDIRDITDTSGFVEENNDAIIKVVGVGGGGCNAVSYMYKLQIPHINFVLCNTDKQSLEMSPVPNKILLGPGRGAGNKPEVGRQYAEEYSSKIAELFTDQTEMVFITAGMGGGTGTGASPVVAKIAKDSGMLTIGIVTIPFMFEGQKKIIKALEGAEEMKKHVDAILIINNENLVELYKDLNFFNAFGKADDTLANAARSISEIISDPCYINVDFQDVKTTLKDSGTAIISTAYGEGEHRISDAIQNALHSPLLKMDDIYSSKRLLLKFMCWRDSPNPLRMEEISEITQFTNKLPSSIDVKWGIGDDPSLGEKVKITVLASGFDMTLRDGEEQNGGGNSGKIIVMGGNGEEDRVVQAQKEAERVAIEEYYGGERLTKQAREADKVRYAVLTPSMFDDYEVIARLERTPAYNRPAKFNEDLKKLNTATVLPESKPDIDSGQDSGSGFNFGSSSSNQPSHPGGDNVITF
ncbi:MAG: cell division protein FtsZ [Muribaculaceae bacterium]|nr:cell division protein FtsZ [Muribaculaceae bacterium]MDE6027643.1 cell division protein FtsZ [Muribaculaceae bacterium]